MRARSALAVSSEITLPFLMLVNCVPMAFARQFTCPELLSSARTAQACNHVGKLLDSGHTMAFLDLFLLVTHVLDGLLESGVCEATAGRCVSGKQHHERAQQAVLHRTGISQLRRLLLKSAPCTLRRVH